MRENGEKKMDDALQIQRLPSTRGRDTEAGAGAQEEKEAHKKGNGTLRKRKALGNDSQDDEDYYESEEGDSLMRKHGDDGNRRDWNEEGVRLIEDRRGGETRISDPRLLSRLSFHVSPHPIQITTTTSMTIPLAR